jgi:hypothetical protein
MSARYRCGAVKLPEKLPTSGTLQRTRNRVVIVGRPPSFRNAADREIGIPCLQRYKITKFDPRFKSLLTLLELSGVSLHDEKTGV